MKDTNRNDITPFQLHNRYISDILNDPPHWFVRIGGFLMLFWVIVIIGICRLIRYPDTIKQEVTYNSSTKLYHAVVPYSKLSTEVPIGATVKIELDNRPQQLYGYFIGTITRRDFSSKKQAYFFTITPQFNNIPTQKSPKYINGTATIIVKERSLFQRLCSSIKF